MYLIIQQGVSINLFIKTGTKKEKELAEVYHYDIYGKRDLKYNYLWDNSVNSVKYRKIKNVSPMYFMVQKDFELESIYQEGFSINDTFKVSNVGIVTSRDSFVIDASKKILEKRLIDFFELNSSDLIKKYKINENKNWKIIEVQNKSKRFNINFFKRINYRPFDEKYIYFDDNFIERCRKEVVQHFFSEGNLGLVFSRQSTDEKWTNIQVTKSMIDNRFHFSYKGIPRQAPLYIYPFGESNDLLSEHCRKANLDIKIVDHIAQKLDFTFTPEKEQTQNTFAPIDILDYIYAVLHSPTYREKYKEFLKIDFPRVPYPKDRQTFWQLVELGGKLRQIHLLESPKVEQYITTYPQDGDNIITRKISKKDFEIYENNPETGRVRINDTQYFDNVPKIAWGFYIGGYQPAQKWLKDRKGRTLTFEDILHYQKIIVALFETDKIMKQIDKIDFIDT